MSCSFNHVTFDHGFLASRVHHYSPMTAMPIARSASLVAFSEMIKIWHVFFGRFQHRTEVLKYTGFRLYGLRIYGLSGFISLIWSMVNQILVLNFSDIWTFQLYGQLYQDKMVYHISETRCITFCIHFDLPNPLMVSLANSTSLPKWPTPALAAEEPDN